LARRFATVAGMITLDGTFWFFLVFLAAFRILGIGSDSFPLFVGMTLGGAFLAALFVAIGTALVDVFFVLPILRESKGRFPKLTETRQVTVNASAPDAVAAIEKACAKGAFRIREKDLVEGRITASKGFSFITSGEAVAFELLELDEATTEITISSHPRSPFAYTDFGKNYRNVETLASLLSSPDIVY
jgi:hypothetical protein